MKNSITPIQLFFIMLQTKVGFGMLWSDSDLFQFSKNDSWIAVVLTGVFTQVMITLIWFCVKKYPNLETPQLLEHLLGKVLGRATTVVYTIYFLSVQIIILFMLAKILNFWVLPETPAWAIILMSVLIITYTGRKTLQSHAYFFGLIVWFIPLFILFFALAFKQADIRYLFPLLDTNWFSLFKGMTAVFIAFVGFETLLFFMSYVKPEKPKESYRAATMANGVLTLVYGFLVFLVTICFSPNELKATSQPIIAMVKAYQYGIIDRYDNIFLCFWLWIVIASMMNYAFLYNRTVKSIFGKKFTLKQLTWMTSAIVFLVAININSITRIEFYQKYLFWFCLGTTIIVPLILFITSCFKKEEKNI